MSESNGKRKKNYYKSNKKSKYSSGSSGHLCDGVNGFMVTCNFKEYGCLHESYNLFNEFADKVYGNYSPDNTTDDLNNDNKQDVNDIEKAIKNEVNLMTTQKKRFQQMITKCNNVLFIKSNDKSVDPLVITSEILKEIETNGKQLTKQLLRLIPIVITFKTICSNFDEIVENYLEKEPKELLTFMVQCKVRNNSDVKRQQMIDKVVAVVKRVRPEWKTDFTDPKLTINLEILNKICCLSLLKDYNKYCKYNLIEFSKKCLKQLTTDNKQLDEK
ncbi:THUMP domain-containing protein 1-like [Oppia nitens]|uniref:THUMP domain-containing protein 1-like n=1 Tax=Oppia nitens TaxID=1686743 RepID=UPI0023DC3016|nr:THUMP domain-containing protein 1-like [Oppia nitens]